MELVKDLGFDGVDIDWEYPKNPKEAHDFVLLLKTTREALDAYSYSHPLRPRFLLTIACPAGPDHYNVLPLPQMLPYLSFLNLMAYDYAGSFSSHTAHQANIHSSHSHPQTTPFSTSAAVHHYTLHGIPAHKILLGMPLYGRAFANTKGIGHSFQGTGKGSWEQGVWDWKVLPKEGSVVEADKAVGASWSEGDGTVVSFDSDEAIEWKVEYLRDTGLGGAMWWESSGDRKVGQGSAVERVVGGLRHLDQEQNCLEYPESKYDNLRKGMEGEELGRV